MQKKTDRKKRGKKVTERRLALLLSAILAAGQPAMPIHPEEFPEEMLLEEIRIEDVFLDEAQPGKNPEEMIFEEVMLDEAEPQEAVSGGKEDSGKGSGLIPLRQKNEAPAETVPAETEPAETKAAETEPPSAEAEKAGTVPETEIPAGTERAGEPGSSAEPEPAAEPVSTPEVPEEIGAAAETEIPAETEPLTEPESSAEAELPAKPESPAESEPESSAEPDPTTELESSAVPDPTTEPESPAEPEPTAEPESTPEAPEETGAAAETEIPAETEPLTEPESPMESEPGSSAVPDPAAEPESPAEPEPESTPEAPEETGAAAETEIPAETEPLTELESSAVPEQTPETEPPVQVAAELIPETEPAEEAITVELVPEKALTEDLVPEESAPTASDPAPAAITEVEAKPEPEVLAPVPAREDPAAEGKGRKGSGNTDETVPQKKTEAESSDLIRLTSGLTEEAVLEKPKAEAAKAEAVNTDMAEAKTAGTEAAAADKAKAETAGTEAASADKVEADKAEAETVGTETAGTEPADTGAADTGTVDREAADMERADEQKTDTGSAGSESAAPVPEGKAGKEQGGSAGFPADRQEILLIPAPLEGETAYQQNVPVGIRVAELPESAGIRKISYRVQQVGEVEPSTTGVLLEKDSKTEGVSGWKGSMVVPSDGLEGLVQVELEVEDWEGARTTQVMALDMDTVAPRITLEYDNNDVRNGWYFRAPRTARIVIEDAHFDRNLVQIRQTAYGEEGAIPLPPVRWTDQGSLHVAEITFDRDGTYTLEIEAEDKSGNLSALPVSESAAPLSFTVDTRAGELWHLSGLEEGGLLGGDGQVSDPDAEVELSFTGEDLEGYSLSLIRTRPEALPEKPENAGVSQEDVTSEMLPAKEGNSAGTLRFHIPPKDQEGISNDGWYTLSVCARDLAGNRQEKEFRFQVNRFGSVYQAEGGLPQSALAETGGTAHGSDAATGTSLPKVLERELVIREYNPSRLCRARAVAQREDGTREVLLEGEEILRTEEIWPGGRGYSYTYRISPSAFPADGTYRLLLDSADAAGHDTGEEGAAGYEQVFRIDITRPELVKVNGLEHARLKGSTRTVQVEALDASGIRRAEARVDGEIVWEKEDFPDPMHISGSFEVTEGEARTVQILLTDMAGNVLDTEERDEGGEYCFLPDYPFARTVTIRQSGFGPGASGGKGSILEILFLAVLAMIPSAGLFCRKTLKRRTADFLRRLKKTGNAKKRTSPSGCT